MFVKDAEYCLLRSEAVVRIPMDIDPAEAAPLLCAGQFSPVVVAARFLLYYQA